MIMNWAALIFHAYPFHPFPFSELSMYLDGAHTVDSADNCASWFKEESFKEKINQSVAINLEGKPFYRILLFNITGKFLLKRK